MLNVLNMSHILKGAWNLFAWNKYYSLWYGEFLMLFNFSTHNKLLSYSAAVSDFIFAAHSLRNGNDPHITSLTGMFVSLNFLLAWKARWECLFARVDTVSRILISGKGGKPENFLVSFFKVYYYILFCWGIYF